MKRDSSCMADAQLKRQVKRATNIDKSQGMSELGPKLQEVPAENEKKQTNNGQTEKLETILTYYSMNGSFPFTDFKSFHDFVMNSLESEVSTSKMMSQIEDMKQNYIKMMNNRVPNLKCSLNDHPEVTKLPGMILGSGSENAYDPKYPFLKRSLKFWSVDPNVCFDVFDDNQLEEFEVKWRKLRLQEDNFHLKERALLREMRDAARNPRN